jgi:hypothetical protein
MTSRGARQTIGRLTRVKEDSFGVYPAVPLVFPIRAIEGAGITPAQEMYPDERWTTAAHETFAPFLGAKTNTVEFKVPYHNDLDGDHGDVFQTALGAKRTGAGVLVLGGGPNNETQVTYTGASSQVQIGDILRITLSDGTRHFRPIKAITAGAPNIATYALQLPTLGILTVTSIEHAAAASGNLYKEDPAGTEDTYAFLGDQDSEPDSVDYIARACIPTTVMLEHATTGRSMLSFLFSGAGYTQDTSGDISDPDPLAGAAVQWSADLWIDPNLAAPAANPQPVISNGFKVNLAPAWEFIEAFKSRTGTTLNQIADTPGVCWRRMKPFQEPVETKLTFADEDWITVHEARTKEQIFFVAYQGDSGGSFSGRAICLWIPQARTLAKPEEVFDKSVKGQNIQWQVEHDTAMGSKAFFAIFEA